MIWTGSLAAIFLIGPSPIAFTTAPAPILTTQNQPSAAPPLQISPSPGETGQPPAQPAESPAEDGSATIGPTIVVTGRREHVPGDPLQHINAKSFALTQSVDQAVIGPVALAYERALPKPALGGIRNVLENLHEPVVFVNFLLQLKPGKAFETLGRFAINSTIGVAGLLDIAKRRPFKLPLRHNGFADTLGVYGVKPGAFLFLPVIGPTTVRDLIGGGLDRVLLPVALGSPFNNPLYSVPVGVLSELDRRAQLDDKIKAVRATADPYVTRRKLYLQERQAEIDHLRGCAVSPQTDTAPTKAHCAPPHHHSRS